MRRLTIPVLALLLALLILTLPARAEVEWCKKDPIVRLNGTQVQILVAVPSQYEALVNGPVQVEVKTPKGVVRELVFTDEGFNGHGEVVTFSDLKGAVKNKTFTTEIRVRVPLDGSRLTAGEVVPVQVEVIPDNAPSIVARGTSNLTQVKLSITGRY